LSRRQSDWIHDRYTHARISAKRFAARRRGNAGTPASNFFDSFPRFYETSQTTGAKGRLNLRYEAIFAQNAAVFQGARVLDIASHDGRWSLAALSTGASEVIGIEAREDLVESARENLDTYAPGKRYDFRVGDVFQVLAEENLEVDVVLCLGFLYHTLRYNELMWRIRSLNPRHLIVDTAVERRRGFFVHVRTERAERARNAVADSFSHGDITVVGRPTIKALRLILKSYGFEIERLSDWDTLIRDNPEAGHVGDYANGGRVTALCTSSTD
jgi:2-polyprenyl-3-methyl-5-hydroxy-6-metoxy-1,4-benzoquinol methylase